MLVSSMIACAPATRARRGRRDFFINCRIIFPKIKTVINVTRKKVSKQTQNKNKSFKCSENRKKWTNNNKPSFEVKKNEEIKQEFCHFLNQQKLLFVFVLTSIFQNFSSRVRKFKNF